MQTLTQTLTFCRSPLLSLALLLQTSCEHDPRKPAAWGCRRSPAESSEINSATSLPQKWPMSCSTEPSQPIRNNLQAFLATTRIQTVLYFLFIYLFYSHSAGYFFYLSHWYCFPQVSAFAKNIVFCCFFFLLTVLNRKKKKKKRGWADDVSCTADCQSSPSPSGISIKAIWLQSWQMKQQMSKEGEGDKVMRVWSMKNTLRGWQRQNPYIWGTGVQYRRKQQQFA